METQVGENLCVLKEIEGVRSSCVDIYLYEVWCESKCPRFQQFLPPFFPSKFIYVYMS
jgi:hypothetical protein